MPVTIERQESHSLIRLDGEFNLTAAGELKRLLLEWLASGGDLQVDLEQAAEIDITLLQLLVAAESAAAHSGAGFAARVSPAAAMAARDAGFDRFPGIAA